MRLGAAPGDRKLQRRPCSPPSVLGLHKTYYSPQRLAEGRKALARTVEWSLPISPSLSISKSHTPYSGAGQSKPGTGLLTPQLFPIPSEHMTVLRSVGGIRCRGQ